ncbi:MAG TPA: hypothetical protein VK483_15130 [Chitinophagaceae bacterium]|nr:hypothetical protein [Chitinophagaceae bacterium]
MGFIFYKKILFQTKHTPDAIQQILSDMIANPRNNAVIEKLLVNDWFVRINFSGNRFQIMIGRNAQWHERSGMHSVLKGKSRKKNNKQESNISMIVRPSDAYVIYLGLMFLFITMFLLYAIANNSTPVIIISSILLFCLISFF